MPELNLTSSPPMLAASGLTKRFEDGRTALQDVSFEVRRGQIFALLGGNGAGKTTTINIFLNLLEPTAGEARVGDLATHVDPLGAKRQLAFVSENVMLYDTFTAVGNLEFFTRLGGRNHLRRDDYRAALRRVGLADADHDRRLSGFSKGMRQKCGLAIAILRDAPTILLDEPTSGLDPQAGHEFLTLLSELRDEGKAILMSTHDIFRAHEVADLIGIMDRGRLVMLRTREELAGEDLEALYIRFMAGGSPAEEVRRAPAAH